MHRSAIMRGRASAGRRGDEERVGGRAVNASALPYPAALRLRRASPVAMCHRLLNSCSSGMAANQTCPVRELPGNTGFLGPRQRSASCETRAGAHSASPTALSIVLMLCVLNTAQKTCSGSSPEEHGHRLARMVGANSGFQRAAPRGAKRAASGRGGS